MSVVNGTNSTGDSTGASVTAQTSGGDSTSKSKARGGAGFFNFLQGIFNTQSSLAAGDKVGASTSASEAIIDGIGVADDKLVVNGRSSGNVSGTLGAVNAVNKMVQAAVKIATIEAEDSLHQSSLQGEVLRDTAVGLTGAALGSAAGTAVAGYFGVGIYTTSVFASGGGTLVAAAAVAAAVGVNHFECKRHGGDIYDIEGKRFSADLITKGHMKGLAGYFHDKLADPNTGKINWSDSEVLGKYERLLSYEIDKQDKAFKDYDSIFADRFLTMYRVGKKYDAAGALQIANSARDELRQLIREQLNLAKIIKALDKNADGMVDLNDLDGGNKGYLDKQDEENIRNALGEDVVLAKNFIDGLKSQKIAFEDRKNDLEFLEGSAITKYHHNTGWSPVVDMEGKVYYAAEHKDSEAMAKAKACQLNNAYGFTKEQVAENRGFMVVPDKDSPGIFYVAITPHQLQNLEGIAQMKAAETTKGPEYAQKNKERAAAFASAQEERKVMDERMLAAAENEEKQRQQPKNETPASPVSETQQDQSMFAQTPPQTTSKAQSPPEEAIAQTEEEERKKKEQEAARSRPSETALAQNQNGNTPTSPSPSPSPFGDNEVIPADIHVAVVAVKKMDENGDRIISLSTEWKPEEAQKIARAVDSNKDGKHSNQELANFITRLNLNPDDPLVGGMDKAIKTLRGAIGSNFDLNPEMPERSNLTANAKGPNRSTTMVS